MKQDLGANLRKLKDILLNETGQLSIFIALIFQVLFVFFAMLINVGLVVHDKINLQNAVDLAAFYGAQRQAELLDELAHINYQIRQDYKLLTWRYRVIGTLGRQGSNSPSEQTLPPARKASPGALGDKAWVNPAYGAEPPSVCVASDQWSDMLINSTQDENYCFNKYGTPTPKIPDLPTIAPFVPGLTESAAFTKLAQQQQLVSCQRAGPLNWAFTMQIYYAYKLAIAARKELFWAIRENLIKGDPTDLNNGSVQEGVRATLNHNLTEGNRNGQPHLEFVNGLANANCNIGDGGEFEFPEVQTAPSILYTNYMCDTDSSPYMVANSITDNLDQQYLSQWDPTGVMQMLASGEPQATNPLHSTLGFEKNPWCMAYYGVKVTTQVRKPFSPFGGTISMTARAFAQPFGGRIGPWYKSLWSRGSPTSDGGDRVDPLNTPRMLSGALDNATPIARLPNYSRYPGDMIGANAEMTLGAQNSVVRSYANNPSKTNRFYLKFYAGFDPIPNTGDVLATNGSPNFNLRSAEVAAVSPDLFDAVYYSIDPNYYQAFVGLTSTQYQELPAVLGQKTVELPDIGASAQNQGFNVVSQINNALGAGFDQSVLPNLYYVIRDWRHLLTGWVQNAIVDFTFPEERFATCPTLASPTLPIPGLCWMGGGRVGYSVRLISKSALMFSGWNIGGQSESPGAILNPPAADF